KNQFCKLVSCPRSWLPVRSVNTYWNTQPTPLASGPSSGVTPAGNCCWAWLKYSSTRLRAQEIAAPSSNKMYKYESPKNEQPSTSAAPGTAKRTVPTGDV